MSRAGPARVWVIAPVLSLPKPVSPAVKCVLQSEGAGALDSLLEVMVGLVHTRVRDTQAVCLPCRSRRCAGT